MINGQDRDNHEGADEPAGAGVGLREVENRPVSMYQRILWMWRLLKMLVTPNLPDQANKRAMLISEWVM
jgi:hypothetical protein